MIVYLSNFLNRIGNRSFSLKSCLFIKRKILKAPKITQEIVHQIVAKIVPQIVPKIVPKVSKMSIKFSTKLSTTFVPKVQPLCSRILKINNVVKNYQLSVFGRVFSLTWIWTKKSLVTEAALQISVILAVTYTSVMTGFLTHYLRLVPSIKSSN